MAYTTHEKIRVYSGFQSRFDRVPFRNDPDGSATKFYLETDDYTKIVPEFGLGGTIAGVSDVQVYLGLSGVIGASRMTVSSVNVDEGSITLSTAPASGSSLVVTYSSSAVPSTDLEEVRKQAESTINQRLSLCYDLPLDPVPSHIVRLATELSAAFLLMRGYGTGSRDTAADGYALYRRLMGNQEALLNSGTDTEVSMVGEVGMVCTPRYQLVDDDGEIIPRNDSDDIQGVDAYKVGGRIGGRIYDITEENFRKKPYQEDVDREQRGSGMYDGKTTQEW